MKKQLAVLFLGLALALSASAAGAQGAWRTIVRPLTFRDLLAEPDTVWMATGEAGVVAYDRASGTFSFLNHEPAGLSSNDIRALARDRSGNLWVGTAARGLSRRAPDGTWRVFNRFDGLASENITCLTAQGDTLWIGTDAGLSLWDGTQISGTLPDGFTPSPFRDNSIVSIVPLGDSLWVFSTQACHVARISTGLTDWAEANTTVDPNNPDQSLGWAVAVDDGERLIGLTRNGVIRVRTRAPGSLWNASTPPGVPTGITIVKDGTTILHTTNSGVFRWTTPGWTNVAPGAFTANASDPATWYAAGTDPSGAFWFAQATGLRRQVSGTTYQNTPFSGPPGNDLYNVEVQNGRVYVTAWDKGIGRFDGANWKNWTAGCGDPCDPDTAFYGVGYSIAILKDVQGYLWFGPWGSAISRLDDRGAFPSFVHYFMVGPSGTSDPNDLHTRPVGCTADSVGGRWLGMDTNDFGAPDRVPLGLEHYDANGAYLANYNAANNAEVLGGRIHALTTDRGGAVWLGSLEGGIQSFLPPTGTNAPSFSNVANTEDLSVRALVALGDTIYAMTTREVRYYARFARACVDSFLLPANPVLAGHPLHVAADRTVYVGTANGVRVRTSDGAITDFTTANSPLVNDEVRAIRPEPGSRAVWIATAGGLNRYDPAYVPPVPPPPPSLRFNLYPNPASLTALGASLRLSGNASSYEGEIYDLVGRLVHRFQAGSNGQLVWDGRDTRGSLVQPGVYYLRVVAAGSSGFARFVLLR